jgi:branched-subunit amino acid ABC-type transport system permease component
MGTAIVGAVASIFGGTVKLVEGQRQKRYGRLQAWLSPRDFDVQRDSNGIFLIAFLLLVLLVLIVIISRTK